MIRRGAVALVLVGLAAGCGASHKAGERGGQRAALQRGTTQPARVRTPPGTPVLVTVVDGDTDRPVPGARVRIGWHRSRSSRLGVARLRVLQLFDLPVYLSAPGYAPRVLRVGFGGQRHVVLRLYRPALQWPMYGVGPTRTQAQTAIHLRPPFRIVWSRGIGSLIEFPAVVWNGVAYIANFAGTVQALSMDDGAIVWRYQTPRGKMAASPAVAGDELVVHGMDGHVWVFDRRNGRLRWRFTIGSPIESSPVVHARVDYFGTWEGNVYALDLRRRRLRWVYRSGYKITSSPSLAGGTLYIGDYGGRLLALSARSGRLRWRGQVNGRIYGAPAVMGGRVFVPSSDGNSLSAFSIGGRLLWRIYTSGYVYSSPAVWAGRVFFGSYNGVLYSVSAASGRILWEVGTGGPISGAAVVVDGVAYAGSFANRIVGVEARTGRVLMRFPAGEYVPVSGNGRRLLFHGYSRVFAVEPVRGR